MAFSGTGKIWMNGTLVDWADAKIHIASHVVHYGSGSSKARAATTRRRARPASGSTRTCAGCSTRPRSTGWSRRSTATTLTEAVLETIRANEFKACYIRPIVYRGYDSLGVNPFPCPVDAAILIWEWGAYLGEEALEQGVDVQGQLVGAHGAEHLPGAGEERRRTTPTRS